jgi:D-glycero-D-manno-heptose 1,7-bisphosphate phosphatase
VANPAIFLDRDGTLIEDVGYPSRPEHIRILAGVARALVRLADAGYKLVVVTNQSGIARGILTEEDLDHFHQALDEQLEFLGARLDAYYSCPHHPDPAAAVRADLAVECDCRKPRPGLILQAAQDLQIDLAASWTVGDKWRDIACGQAAGTRTIRLPSATTGNDPRPPHVEPPTAEVADLDGAATFILGHPDRQGDAEASPDREPAPSALHLHDAPAPVAEPQSLAAPVPPVIEPPVPESRVEEAEESEEEVAEAPAAAAPEVSPPPAEPEEEEEEEEEEEVAPRAAPAEPAEPDAPALSLASRRERREEAAPAKSSASAAPSADVPTTLLREVLGELRRLERTRHPPSLSLLHLLAYILQAGAAACFVFGLVSAERMMFLLITCICLLVALTLLVIERRP